MLNTSVYVVGDSTVDFVSTYLQQCSQSKIQCEVAPYNQVSQVLLSTSTLKNMLLWTSPDIQIPSFDRLLLFETVDINDILHEVEQFSQLIKQAASNYDSLFMLLWSFPPDRRWPLGLANKPEKGACDILHRMNTHLVDTIGYVSNIYFIDQGLLQSDFYKPIHDPRLYAIGRIRYTVDYMRHVAEHLYSVILSALIPCRKLIICDLDDTLWGGTIAEDGISGIKIGGNDAIGEAHLLLQRELKALSNRGIILAISSKNDIHVAINAISHHPNMILRESDFAAIRINWGDKAENISSILQELNLLSSCAVFLDNSLSERQRVKEALPDIVVPDLPSDVSEWSGILNSLRCFETLELTEEDIHRKINYRNELKRRESNNLLVSLDEWLKSLQLSIKVQLLTDNEIPRCAQRMNKTNQFNLTTRRLSEADLKKWSSHKNRRCFTFSVSDRYGNSGLTSFLSTELANGQWKVVDFVMSCRVMGKGVEEAILSEVIDQLQCDGKLAIIPIQTKRNSPICDFSRRVAPNGHVLPNFKCPSHVIIDRI